MCQLSILASLGYLWNHIKQIVMGLVASGLGLM